MAKKTKDTDTGRFEWPFGMKNYIVFAAGIVVIILGYISLAAGSITLAPILLVLGYCVLIPVSIMIGGKKDIPSTEDVNTGS
ncbi:MAG: hypothetical protein ABIJ45_04160 [Candidatus Zixiibacteriota bacterium]